MTTGLRLGAPGIYGAPPDTAAAPGLTAVALDEAGFVGVAARGPADVPTPVGSYAEYLTRFGTGPGLLPLAVAAFFAQGGRRAQVPRVGPDLPDAHTLIEQGTRDAAGRWTPLRTTGGIPVRWLARDPGRWADTVTVTLAAAVGQRFTVDSAAAAPAIGPVERSGDDADRLVLPPTGLHTPVGALLHVRTAGGSGIRWIEATDEREVRGVRRTTWVLDRPLPAGAPTLGLVVATVTVHDHAPEGPTVETFDVGLSSRHPRWLAAVLAEGSRLVTPDPAGAPTDQSADLRIALADPLLPPIGSTVCRPGADHYGDITVVDLLGRSPGDPPDLDPTGESAHRGAEQLARVDTLGLLAVPDLAWNGVVAAEVTDEPPDPAPDGFTPCTGPRSATRLHTPGDDAVYLDARLPDQLAVLRDRQQWLVELAEATQRFVVLLDAPAGLSTPAVASWRTGFDSSYAAAYHPWLGILPPESARPTGDAPTARQAPPSAFAAGVIAATEIAAGLPTGPANALAAGAVTLGERITDAEHDTLHPLGVNVFRAERDGFRLTAARTLALDPAYRQLTVRRLVTMLRLTLDRESQWVVFEPHTAALRAVLVLHVTDLLREQFRAGAFAGATEADSFFVRADADLNPPESVALGRIVLEVGVAPSAPLEFLVLRITQDGDAVDVQEVPGG